MWERETNGEKQAAAATSASEELRRVPYLEQYQNTCGARAVDGCIKCYLELMTRQYWVCLCDREYPCGQSHRGCFRLFVFVGCGGGWRNSRASCTTTKGARQLSVRYYTHCAIPLRARSTAEDDRTMPLLLQQDAKRGCQTVARFVAREKSLELLANVVGFSLRHPSPSNMLTTVRAPQEENMRMVGANVKQANGTAFECISPREALREGGKGIVCKEQL